MPKRDLFLWIIFAFSLSACKKEVQFNPQNASFLPPVDTFSSPSSGSGNNTGTGEGEEGEISNPGSGSDGGNIPGMVTDNFIQDQFTERYDFLWVVDNSGSMSNIHDFMSQNLTAFATTLESRRSLDWQMAVTITDHVANNGQLIESDNQLSVISHTTPNATTEWANLINNITGTSHSGWEQGLESGYAALENHGNEFSRTDVPLIVTYLSDEEDYSCESNCMNFSGLPENLTGWIPFNETRYVSQFQQLGQINGSNVVVYPIVHLRPLHQPDSCSDNYGFEGARYKNVQSLLGTGASLSICQEDLANSFDQVAQLTANLGVCFSLSQQANTNQPMIVKVDGSEIIASQTNGYVYEVNNNQVCFNGSIIPGNGAQIEVSYFHQ